MPAHVPEQSVASLLRWLREACSVRDACALAGIGQATFYKWLRWGEEGRSDFYVDLAERIAQARADGHKPLIERVRQSTDWRAAAWLLARLDRESWGDAPPKAIPADAEVCSVRSVMALVNFLTGLIPEERRDEAIQGVGRLFAFDEDDDPTPIPGGGTGDDGDRSGDRDDGGGGEGLPGGDGGVSGDAGADGGRESDA